ncbi:MAG: radical SAM protein, partial [Candidatus Omnitrophota bacterium]
EVIEYIMPDIARRFQAGDWSGIKGICYREGGSTVCGETGQLISDLDALPFQDYGGGNKFFIEGSRVRRVDPLVAARELRVFASRGCPFNCSYCYNSILRSMYPGQRYHRIRSVDSVIGEIERALSVFKNIRKVKFDDDTFVFPRDWVIEFSKEYKKRIGLPFEILLNAGCADRESLDMLTGAGLRRAQVGIQTGSADEARDAYNRDLSAEKIRAFAGEAKEMGLALVYDVILDNPMATYEQKMEIVNMLLSLPRPFDLFMYSLTVFPGTRLCDILLERGLISPDDVEGRAAKSFRQFRFSFGYPREKDDLFVACLVSLTSKGFIPKAMIKRLCKSGMLRAHPFILSIFAEICNYIKLMQVFIRMAVNGELSFWKIKEYGLPRRFLIQ